jgi:putative transposase
MYDADGHGIEWGEGDMSQVFVLCRQADQIQSKISKKRATWSLRRAYHRKLRKIKDKIKECHNKLALFLCENYRVVLIPKFQVSQMVKKHNRKIRSKTVRQMCCWSHYAFREALKNKSALFPWCKIVEVGEAYTSKTCEECGTLHQKLGGNKIFKCPKCNHTADRDLHAAKNILLRYITRENLLSEGWD